MLKITTPGYFDKEAAYVLHVVLTQNLGYHDYELECMENTDYIFTGPNGSFTIANAFFRKAGGAILEKSQLPAEAIEIKLPEWNANIVTLYGNSNVVSNQSGIFIGGDIIASAFLLLTQWDAMFSERDELGRVSLGTSIVGKFNLYHRPVVNEYIHLIKNLMHTIGISCETKNYQPVFTCDVDVMRKYNSIRNLAGALYHSGLNISVWKKNTELYFDSSKDVKKDPYFSFDLILNKVKEKNLPSVFYFMAGISNPKYDHADYDVLKEPAISLIRDLANKGCDIGLHPSFESCISSDLLLREKSKLEEATGNDINYIRQHYLRYQPSLSWSIYESLAFSFDSSVQFTEGLGFACGMCTPYFLFDVHERRMTNVEEWPLILMKKKDYVKNVETAFSSFRMIIDEAKKYNGRFQFLFHNSDVETDNEKQLFQMTLDYLSAN